MMDLEHEASTQRDTGTTLRQRQPQGSIVATVYSLYILYSIIQGTFCCMSS